ncbi:hypothetical protein U5922_006855 [Aquicoccus sp. G2-2]|uniref:hypothetical protein n=1 Tax=Aquicoccus sp. G2-2 TaxID=3092120 RepID=UPI002ADF09EC|nr:hypothetical protein [Aquicoccus sp. G2-2]MEA1113209.1 hypothetical protein [Aquicoccus sp. G2-2]
MQEQNHTPQDATARHARLFELLHQQSVAAQPRSSAQPSEIAGQDIASFRETAHRSLLPQEQAALGISASFGR